MGSLTKPPTITYVGGSPAYPPAPAIHFRLFAPPSPRSAAYRQKGNFPDGPEDFHQWSMLDYSPPDGWYGPIRYMEFIRFPGVPVVANSNGFPNPGHNGPIRGYFDVPTLSGVHREWRDYYREGPSGMWVPRVGTFTDPPYCQTGGPAMVTMMSGFPGRAAVAAVPQTEIIDRHEGWNAGANSFQVIDGDLHTVFQVDIAAAGAVGLAPARADVSRIDNMEHAIYFDTDPSDGTRRFALMESGRLVSPYSPYLVEDEFEIRRAAGAVRFIHNGAELQRSLSLSYGPLRVGAALYRAGDTVL
ncbi:MAG: hypothetical protein JF596_18115 [Stenotrophomonas sp.]|nr:hypothetical protein [Stenotrophomonas sp.]